MTEGLSVRKVFHVAEEDLEKLRAIQQALTNHPDLTPLSPGLSQAETVRTAIALTHALLVEGASASAGPSPLAISVRAILTQRERSYALMRARQAEAAASLQQAEEIRPKTSVRKRHPRS